MPHRRAGSGESRESCPVGETFLVFHSGRPRSRTSPMTAYNRHRYPAEHAGCLSQALQAILLSNVPAIFAWECPNPIHSPRIAYERACLHEDVSAISLADRASQLTDLLPVVDRGSHCSTQSTILLSRISAKLTVQLLDSAMHRLFTKTDLVKFRAPRPQSEFVVE
jgi:hypothetical protein